MVKLRLISIRVYAWLFFVLVVLGPVSLGLGFISRLSDDGIRNRLFPKIASQMKVTSAETPDLTPVVMLMDEVRVPLLVLLLVILGGSVVALFLFIRHFIVPMDKMASAARRIAEGRLEESVPVYRCAEIRRLGESYNDLSVNLQEILLLIWNLTRHSSFLLNQMIERNACRTKAATPDSERQGIEFIYREISSLENIIRSFDLYEVHIEGNRLMDAAEPRMISD